MEMFGFAELELDDVAVGAGVVQLLVIRQFKQATEGELVFRAGQVQRKGLRLFGEERSPRFALLGNNEVD